MAGLKDGDLENLAQAIRLDRKRKQARSSVVLLYFVDATVVELELSSLMIL